MIDLKDTHFGVPLHSDCQKFVKFQWKVNNNDINKKELIQARNTLIFLLVLWVF